MMRRRYAKRTIETYIHWIRRFILFHQKRHPETMGDAEVEAFLDHLVLQREVAGSTQGFDGIILMRQRFRRQFGWRRERQASRGR